MKSGEVLEQIRAANDRGETPPEGLHKLFFKLVREEFEAIVVEPRLCIHCKQTVAEAHSCGGVKRLMGTDPVGKLLVVWL
jgi:hypothetical protein